MFILVKNAIKTFKNLWKLWVRATDWNKGRKNPKDCLIRETSHIFVISFLIRPKNMRSCNLTCIKNRFVVKGTPGNTNSPFWGVCSEQTSLVLSNLSQGSFSHISCSLERDCSGIPFEFLYFLDSYFLQQLKNYLVQ